ncbi:MAG: DUF2288 domain-containing protein [Gammaproteobacteria bacterium]|nr:DUF2288 domain-containing protein [Gammaproteobacteria bacterium]
MDLGLITPELNNDELLQKLNGETAKLSWKELEPHFARGVVVRVDSSLDLVQVAMSFSRDDRDKVETLMNSGSIATASDSDAINWTECQPSFWAVVVAPWVLIQEIPGVD